MFLKMHRKSRQFLGSLVSVTGLLALAVPGNALSSGLGAGSDTVRVKISEPPPTGKVILGLEDVLHLTLTNNPRIGSADSAVRAQQGRMLQAGLLPNPSLSLDLENIGISGADFADEDLQASFLIGQRIELGGQRGLRKQVEHHQTRLARSDYEKVRLTIITETTIAFAEALAQQILLQLAQEQTRIAQELLKAVQLQVFNGAVSSAEVPRAEVEVSLQQIETVSRSRSLRAAFRRLASMWGENSFTYSRLRGTFNSSQPLASLETFIGLLGTSFKEERLKIEIDRAQSVIALEDSRRIPDIELGMGPKYFTGSDIWGLQMGVEFSLPIFDRNQGRRLEARAEFDTIRDAGRDERMRAYRDLIRSYENMSIAHHEAETLSDIVIPQARKAYMAMRRAHREGAIELTSVLDAQRSLFLLESRLVEAKKAYQISLARTNLVVGGPATRDLKEEK